jgi:hypothetical protein
MQNFGSSESRAEPGRMLLCHDHRQKIKRGLEELEATINAFPEQHIAAPKPVQVVKSADDSLAAIERFCVYDTPA